MKRTHLITGDFFKGIPISTFETDEKELPLEYGDLSEMMAEALLVLDFQKRNFKYVSNHELCLCGHTQESVMAQGYEFFEDAVFPDDLNLWIDMHNKILKCLYCDELPADKINYFACTFRVKNSFSGVDKTQYIMVYLKLKPKWLNGQLRYGICLLSGSVVPKPDNLRVYYHNRDYAEYSSDTGRWTHCSFSPLRKREREMLVWIQQGLSQKEMADTMCVSVNTIEHMRYILF